MLLEERAVRHHFACSDTRAIRAPAALAALAGGQDNGRRQKDRVKAECAAFTSSLKAFASARAAYFPTQGAAWARQLRRQAACASVRPCWPPGRGGDSDWRPTRPN